MPEINWGYTPGSANSLAQSYNASVENRNLLAKQAADAKAAQLNYDVANDQFNQLKRVRGVYENNDINTDAGLAELYRVDPAAARLQEKAMQDKRAARTTNYKTSLDLAKQVANNIVAAPTEENAIAHMQRLALQTGENFDQDIAEVRQLGGDPVAIATWAKRHALDADKQLKKMDTTDLHDRVLTTEYDPVTGARRVISTDKKGMTGAELATAEDQRQRRQIERDRLAAENTRATQSTPPVPVVDPNDPTKIILVDRKEAIEKRLTPATAQDQGLAPKEILKRNAAYPAQTQAVKAFEANADSFTNDLTTLLNHPGLEAITGLVGSRTPNLTGEARAAQALYDKIIAKGGFSVLQAIREASKTGGALGNLSNQEGTQLKSAFAAISQNQNVEDVQNALKEAISQIQSSKARMREAYDSTYEYKNAGGGASGVDGSNPLLK